MTSSLYLKDFLVVLNLVFLMANISNPCLNILEIIDIKLIIDDFQW